MRSARRGRARRRSAASSLICRKSGSLGAVALHVDAVVAQADGAGADDLEGDIERGVLREEVAALGLQALGVGGERVEHLARGAAVDAGEDRARRT